MKYAFTLIELLVVIAIIAILAAILFPVFAQAKLAAKKTQGLSQAKQTGTAAQIYLNDSDDTYFPYRFSSTVPINPTYLKLQAAGDPKAATMASQGSNTINAIFFNQLLEPYIKNDDIWKSPGNPDAWVNFQDKGAWDVGYHSYGGQNSYAANNYLLKSNAGTNAGVIAESSNTILLIDATYYNSLPAQPDAGFCKIGGYDPTNGNAGSSYNWYWKHLGNSQLNFASLGSRFPNDPSNADTWKKIDSRFGGVLNTVRADTSAKAMQSKHVVSDLRNDPAASMWNPLKSPCE
jgi:prepilin-type N-terminal cleavage/methylation domain-containing protein